MNASTTTPAATQATLMQTALSARTWRETAHLILGVVPSVLSAAVVLVTGYAVIASITVVGLVALAAVIVAARCVYVLERWRFRYILGERLPDLPSRLHRHPGLLGWVRDSVTDRYGWRCVLYALLAFPLGAAQAYVVMAWWLLSLSVLTCPLWSQFVPERVELHLIGVSGYADEWPVAMQAVIFGLAGVLIAPWIVRGLTNVDRLRIRLLARPSDPAAVSERRRTSAVRESGSQLRRIERDLHDGAQARMVALALELGRARDDLATGRAPAEIAARVAAAHEEAKLALGELRDLARGIYPAVLEDLGLDGAVPLLIARSPVPVHTDIDVTTRPERAVEVTAYFCIAELLTNVTKHSGATTASVRVRRDRDRLRVEVADDGRGGASVTPGGGLAGLVARADSIGGEVTVDSPAGGPTVVRLEFPCAL